VFVVSAGSSWADGLCVNEFDTVSMGFASVGAQAFVNNTPTAFHNPAGITRLDDREVIFMTPHRLILRIKHPICPLTGRCDMPGAQYKWSEKLSIGGAFVYADYGDAKSDNHVLKGDYDRNDIFFGFNVNWKF